MTSRTYDVVVYGATGFTGKLIAEHYAKQYSVGDFSWAVAGRSEKKLREVVDAAVKLNPSLKDNIGVIVANMNDSASLRRMCESTKVVLTTVGPYSLYGRPLVEACVGADTDYCDLTGEPWWAKEMVDEFHDVAKARGARIVNACGFDSLPTDLGMLAACDKADEEVVRLESMMGKVEGGVSGGTLASLLSFFEISFARQLAFLKMVANPYVLCGDNGGASTVNEGDQALPRWSKIANSWTAPFTMAYTNIRIAQRSQYLLKYKYGSNVKLSETVLVRYLVVAVVMSLLSPMMVFLAFPPLRWLAKKILPAGQGPSRKVIESGSFVTNVVATTKTNKMTVCTVKGNLDPGYGSTSIMIGESAIQLAKTRGTASERENTGGVLTGASARGLGLDLVDRLHKAGITFNTRTIESKPLEAVLQSSM